MNIPCTIICSTMLIGLPLPMKALQKTLPTSALTTALRKQLTTMSHQNENKDTDVNNNTITHLCDTDLYDTKAEQSAGSEPLKTIQNPQQIATPNVHKKSTPILIRRPSNSHLQQEPYNFIQLQIPHDNEFLLENQPKTIGKFNHQETQFIAFPQDISINNDSIVHLYDTATGKSSQCLCGQNSPITDAVFSSDDNFLALAGCDGSIKAWDLELGNCLYAIKGHEQEITSITISPDNTKLVTTSKDHWIKIWSSQTGKFIEAQKFDDMTTPASAIFFPDNTSLLVTCYQPDKNKNFTSFVYLLNLKSPEKNHIVYNFQMINPKAPDGCLLTAYTGSDYVSARSQNGFCELLDTKISTKNGLFTKKTYVPRKIISAQLMQNDATCAIATLAYDAQQEGCIFQKWQLPENGLISIDHFIKNSADNPKEILKYRIEKTRVALLKKAYCFAPHTEVINCESNTIIKTEISPSGKYILTLFQNNNNELDYGLYRTQQQTPVPDYIQPRLLIPPLKELPHQNISHTPSGKGYHALLIPPSKSIVASA